ncbi:MAG: hypothetical protein IPL27_08415 [Lewinellaceae bacterium]|nr:hypothetical protein [Lewinellaceae bacterium]
MFAHKNLLKIGHIRIGGNPDSPDCFQTYITGQQQHPVPAPFLLLKKTGEHIKRMEKKGDR